MKLVKLSSPGWEKEFQTELELKEELYSYICYHCREGCCEEFDGFELIEPAVDSDSSIGEMLWTACGCEFLVEGIDE